MYSVCTLLKVVSYYDLSVLSMSVMGFQKKVGGWVGGVSSVQVFLGFLQFFLTLQSPLLSPKNLFFNLQSILLK